MKPQTERFRVCDSEQLIFGRTLVQAFSSPERWVARASRRDHLAELDALLQADGPELVACRAVRFYRVATLEQSRQDREGKSILWSLTLAARTCRRKGYAWHISHLSNDVTKTYAQRAAATIGETLVCT